MTTCKTCGKEFYSGVRGRPAYKCSDCKARAQRLIAIGKDKVSDSRNRGWRLRKHGITDAQFEEMLTAQSGRCAICSAEMTRGPWTPTTACIDHCHESKRIRSILCRGCNTAIGQFKDNPALLRLAALYLEKHRG